MEMEWRCMGEGGEGPARAVSGQVAHSRRHRAHQALPEFAILPMQPRQQQSASGSPHPLQPAAERRGHAAREPA